LRQHRSGRANSAEPRSDLQKSPSPTGEALAGEMTAIHELTDSELTAKFRESGCQEAAEELHGRHHRAVLAYARLCSRDGHTAEDLASEAFTSALEAVRSGHGPNGPWRPYLLIAVRRTAARWFATDRRHRLALDFEQWLDGREPAATDAETWVVRQEERSLVRHAFLSLNERWQSVLWYTAVEQEPAGVTARLLGLTPSGVASLASRAREGLREAYLTAHAQDTLASEECRHFSALLGAYVRRGEHKAGRAVERHLAGCARCRGAVEELTYLNDRFGAYLATGILLWAGPAYLATRSAAVAAAAPDGVADAGGAGPDGGPGVDSRPLIRPATVTAGAAALAVAVLAIMYLAPGEPDTEEDGPVRARSSSAAPHVTASASRTPVSAAPPAEPSASAPPEPPPVTARPSQTPVGAPLAACTGFDADNGDLKPAADEHEVPRSVLGWTHSFPGGWRVDNSRMPDNGVREWRGWTLTTREFWERTAAGQYREDFTRGDGVIAVADPDEWNDLGDPSATSTFDSTLVSPACSAPSDGRLTLSYVTHYWQLGAQRGEVLVSFDAGPDRVLKTYSADRFDSRESLAVAVPRGARTVTVKFRLHDARNDWYWALDHVRLS
jgi:RNA polymerase sigma factor (sigma-70 family)